MTGKERDYFVMCLANWLKPYTQEVIIKVMEKAEEISKNEFAVKMLEELYERDLKEAKSFITSIDNLYYCYNDFKEFNPHANALTHAGSYRDILYDMYIKEV